LSGLDKLTKISGMYVDKVQHSGQFDVFAQMLTVRKGETDDNLARAADTLGIANDGASGGSVDDS
ncbi:unnamed protein product, partial [marine sediment metagenome]